MADIDNFTAGEVEGGEKDLVADFLSREQDTLAELGDDQLGKEDSGEKDLVADFLSREQGSFAELGDDQFGEFGGSSEPRNDFGGDEFGGQGYGNVSASQDDYDPFSGQSDDYGQTEDHSSDPYNQVKQMDRQRIEPEKLRIWREEQVEMLQKKDAESERKKAEWRDIARKELEEWFKHRNEQVDKAKKVNREGEEAFIQQRDERKPGGEWERVCRQCDFNPKGSRNTKDVSRMRSILLQLKQTPIER